MIPVDLLFFGHPHMSYVRIILTKPLKTSKIPGFDTLTNFKETFIQLGFDGNKKINRGNVAFDLFDKS